MCYYLEGIIKEKIISVLSCLLTLSLSKIPFLSIHYLIFNFQTMTDSELLTVSLGTWMELPNLSMKDWRPDVIKSVGGRINVSTVAAYYKGNLL